MLKTVIKQALKLDLAVHNFTYRVAGYLATKLEGGVHPKHRITGYHHFFREHINEGDIVLDIGCGNGELTHDLSFKAQWIYGMEIDESKLKYARDHNWRPNIIYIRGDATDGNIYPLCSDRKKFDVIIMSNLLEHIENRVVFLRQWAGKTEKILLRVPLLNRGWLPVYMKEMGLDYRLDADHKIEHTLGSLISELREAGLTLTEHTEQFGELWGTVEKC